MAGKLPINGKRIKSNVSIVGSSSERNQKWRVHARNIRLHFPFIGSLPTFLPSSKLDWLVPNLGRLNIKFVSGVHFSQKPRRFGRDSDQWTPKRLERYLRFWSLCGGWHAGHPQSSLTIKHYNFHVWQKHASPAAISLASPNHTAGLMEVSFQSL